MIVKIPTQRQFPTAGVKKRFDDLLNYLQEKFGQVQAMEFINNRYYPEEDQILPGFTDILTYATAGEIPTTADADQDHKCRAVEVHGVTSIKTAIAEMNAVAAKNKRVKDPAYHFILSWPEHENPDDASIFAAARKCLTALKLDTHQYMIAIHSNTDNIHCHVAANRIHPETGKSQHIEFAKEKLHWAARQCEIDHHWTHDNGIFIVQIANDGSKTIVRNQELQRKETQTPETQNQPVISKQPKQPNAQTWTDTESLINWIRTEIAPDLKKQLPDFTQWNDLHQYLANHGIQLKDTGGGGMRITATDQNTGEMLDIAASKALRCLNRQDLETRWGGYAKPQPQPEPQTQTTPQLTPDISKRKLNHAQDFDRINQFGGRFPPAPGEDRLQDVPSLNVVHTTGSGLLLLPDHPQNHMEFRPTERHPDVRRHGNDGRKPDLKPGTPMPIRIPEVLPSPARDLEKRAVRKAERAQERLQLRQRYQQYQQDIRKTDTTYTDRKNVLKEAQRTDRKNLKLEFDKARQQLRQKYRGRAYTHLQEALALLAMEKLAAKLKLEQRHHAEMQTLAVTRQPPLPWRLWLLEQAQMGDQPALSALRGIVYQAKRDAKKTNPDQSVEMPAMPVTDADTLAYLAVIEKLLKEEKRETAIRSANAVQIRPHQCDALLRQIHTMSYRVTGNGNVKFYDIADNHLFTDRGNRITFDREHVTDKELRLALLHAREKYGNKLTLTGEDPVFLARMAKMADDLGMTVINPELRPIIAAHQAQKALAKPKSHISKTTVPAPSPTATTKAPESTDQQQIPATQPEPEKITSAVAPVATTAPALAQEMSDEQQHEYLRQEILKAHPRAQIVLADRKKSVPHVGPIVSATANAFIQKTGRSLYTLHPKPLPDTVTAEQKKPVTIQYRKGSLVHVLGREGIAR